MPLTDDEEIAQYEKPRALYPRGPSRINTHPAVQAASGPQAGPTVKAAASRDNRTQYQKDFQDAINRSKAWKARMRASMTQGEVDSRRGQGGGYALPGGQAVKMGPDIAGGDAYTAYDSQQRKTGMSPEQLGRDAFVAQAIHEGEANRGVPDAALTMIPGQGYIVDPRRQGVNSVPTSAVSAPPPLSAELAPPVGLTPTGQRPVSPNYAGMGSVPSTFGGDQRNAIANMALPSQPAASTSLPQAPWEVRPDLIPRSWEEENKALGKSTWGWLQKQKRRLDAWNRRVNKRSLGYYQEQRTK